MNNRQNGRRRGRGGQQARNGQPGNPHSNSRLDNRQRGNAVQLLEKYKTLARDAQMQGDRVNTEYYLQFADHYFRVLSENRSRMEEQRPQRRDEFGQEYANEDEGEQAPRTFGTRDFADDTWDEGDEESDGRSQAQQRDPQGQREPREPQGQREPTYPREMQSRETQSAREPQRPREMQTPRDQQDGREQPAAPRDREQSGQPRPPREPRAAQPRGERRPLRMNNGTPAALEPEAGEATPAAAAPGLAEASSPRIEFDRLPPALAATPAPELPLDPAEGPADENAAPKRRRTRKPKAATDTAPAEL